MTGHSQNYAGRCDTSGCPGFGTIHTQTSPVDPSSSDVEETHEPTQTRFPGHWRCSCGSVGTDEMMSLHLIRNGWCGDCWGSGSDPYPSLGICRTCGGSGEIADVERLDRQMARIRRQVLDRRQVRA